MSDLELQKFFEFDASDLAVNRSLKLSQKQLDALVKVAKGTKKFYSFVAIGLAILGGYISNEMIKTSSKDELLGGLIFLWIMFGFFILLMLAIAFSKADYTVEKVEGSVNFVKVEKTKQEKSATGTTHTRTYQVYEMRVGKVNFHDVPEELLNLIKENDKYLIYYLPNVSHKILSLEYVSSGK